MLRYLRPAGGGLAAVALATAGAYFVAMITSGHPTPWWPYLLLLGLALLGGVGYVVGQPDSKPRAPATVAAATAQMAPDVPKVAEGPRPLRPARASQ